MIKVKNIAAGPRGLHTADGPVMLHPGQEVELDVSKEHLESSKKTGWFTFEGESNDAAYEAMSDEELTAVLKKANIVPDGRWGHDRLVAEVKKLQDKE